MEQQLDNRNRGFTLVELLMVLGVVAVLAGALLAVLSTSGARSRQTACLDNLKQLAAACQMYCADNNDRFALNLPQNAGVRAEGLWVAGNIANPFEATNTALVRKGLLYPYLNSETALHCPSDTSHVDGHPRVRSYSMNGWFGSRYMEQAMAHSAYRTFVKNTELASVGPRELWIIADEHESTIDDGFFLVTMNDSRPF
ncbi:MAG TPA: prepilin-type N-terminal cleavage/methylation domain-containing protein, partial [Verrucomicrobiota bacterium]|nr:prepilin-type N-terminal cleavage/methylation domain-containing protein [Verrucomicrobiota bacterium]